MANTTEKQLNFKSLPKQVKLKDFNRYIKPYLSKRNCFLLVCTGILIFAYMFYVWIQHGMDEMEVNITKKKMAKIEIALAKYCIDIGEYPTTEQGLRILWQVPASNDIEVIEKWNGPYVVYPISTDFWDNPYVYRNPGTRFGYDYDLLSYGRDGELGGIGFDADIFWEGDEFFQDEYEKMFREELPTAFEFKQTYYQWQAAEHALEGNLVAANAGYDLAIHYDPENVELYINRAILKIERKQYDFAIKDLDRAYDLTFLPSLRARIEKLKATLTHQGG